MNGGATSLEPSVALSIRLRVDAAPSRNAFKATIDVAPLDLAVRVVREDVRDAIHAAAEACAHSLCDRGYPVTAAEVLDSLDPLDAMDPERAASRRCLN